MCRCSTNCSTGACFNFHRPFHRWWGSCPSMYQRLPHRQSKMPLPFRCTDMSQDLFDNARDTFIMYVPWWMNTARYTCNAWDVVTRHPSCTFHFVQCCPKWKALVRDCFSRHLLSLLGSSSQGFAHTSILRLKCVHVHHSNGYTHVSLAHGSTSTSPRWNRTCPMQCSEYLPLSVPL